MRSVFGGTRLRFNAIVMVACCALPLIGMAGEAFVCQEIKAALAEAGQGFTSYKGALAPQVAKTPDFMKTYLAKKTMAGASACSVMDVSLEEPKMRLLQTAYRCQFSGVSKLDKALRAHLTRCVPGEVDDPSDPDDLTIWVNRVSSGEGYRVTEMNAHANIVDGLTLLVRQSVCTNKGNGKACED